MNILFWNTEGGSERAQAKAEEERRKLDAVERSAEATIRRHARAGATRPITRAALRGRKAEMRNRRPGLPKRTHQFKAPILSRAEKAELLLMAQRDRAAKARRQFRNKAALMEGIMNLREFPHVFLCEIMHTHPHADAPKPVSGQDERPKSYLYYASGARTALAQFPTASGAGWFTGVIPAAKKRVPKAVVINNVRFCFWHASSGNNGQEVVDMYNGLAGAGQPFVLFGDLNCDPQQLINRGLPAGNIIEPLTATRISGRKLDYAVTNVPHRFKRHVRHWGQYPTPRDIKDQTGSDHSPMILTFKG